MILCKFSYDTMQLADLIQVIRPLRVSGSRSGTIKGITYDSRLVLPGYLFVALRGADLDGLDFVQDALERGAIAVVTEQIVPVPSAATLIEVEDARKALADIASVFHRNPSQRLNVVGITGTNGKTTTSYMLREILRADRRSPGLIGTVEYLIGERVIPASRTTPQSPELQAMLDQMVEANCQSAVMEVSSHALDQHRVRGVEFDVAVFTNLTQDHLDYHLDLDAYYRAKARLFHQLEGGRKPGQAVINIDCAYGRRLLDDLPEGIEVLTTGCSKLATVRAENIVVSSDGLSFKLNTPWGNPDVKLKLLGRFNVENALSAIAAGLALGIDLGLIVQALENMEVVPGRLEEIPGGPGKIFVDYAHTHDALDNVLRTLRELTPGRLVVAFGCGGNRDPEKRVLMGRVAHELADTIIVTNDNPRREDPKQIARDILKGMPDLERVNVVLDREEAIAEGIARLQEGDTLLIAGKGHENYMEFEHTIVPFDDRQTALKLISRHVRD